MLTYIDTHTHLSDSKLIKNIEVIRDNYLKSNVNFVVDTGCDLKSSLSCKNNADKYSEVYFTSGIHPESTNSFNDDINKLEPLLLDDKCIALGEVGLDYHYEGFDKSKQIELFESQIYLANKLNLPLVIHLRDACQDMLSVLNANKNYLNNGFLMHCFSESYETAKLLLDLNATFSFGGAITFKNSKRGEVLKKLPLDRILFETDAPYLTPHPYRGQLNEPKNVIYVYKFACELFKITEETLCEKVLFNFKNLFKKICSQTK